MSSYEMLTVVTAGVFAVLIWTLIAPRLGVTARGSESAVRCWVDLWIPLVVALTTAIPMALCGDSAEVRSTGWFAVGPVVIAATIACGVIVLSAPFFRRGSELMTPQPGQPQYREAERDAEAGGRMPALMSTSVLVLMVGLADRFSSWHGQVLVTAAVIWLWMNNPVPNRCPDERVDSESDPASEGGRPVFLTHWGGGLAQPVPGWCKCALGVLLVVIAIGSWSASPYPVIVPSLAGAVVVASAGVAVAWRTGRPSLGIRLLCSAVVLSVLLSLGGMAFSLVPHQFGYWYGSANDLGFHRTYLQGLSMLLPSGFVITGLALVLRMSECDEAARERGVPAHEQAARRPIGAVLRLWVGVLLLLSGVVLASLGGGPIQEQIAYWQNAQPGEMLDVILPEH